MITIPINEQLESYATWTAPEMFERYGIDWQHTDYRRFFTFSRRQLIEHLKQHAEHIDSYLKHSSDMKGVQDQQILAAENGRYVIYSQDHGQRRDEYFYSDRYEAAADYLMAQHGMFSPEET